jgi:hypothetical protein
MLSLGMDNQRIYRRQNNFRLRKLQKITAETDVKAEKELILSDDLFCLKIFKKSGK